MAVAVADRSLWSLPGFLRRLGVVSGKPAPIGQPVPASSVFRPDPRTPSPPPGALRPTMETCRDLRYVGDVPRCFDPLPGLPGPWPGGEAVDVPPPAAGQGWFERLFGGLQAVPGKAGEGLAEFFRPLLRALTGPLLILLAILVVSYVLLRRVA